LIILSLAKEDYDIYNENRLAGFRPNSEIVGKFRKLKCYGERIKITQDLLKNGLRTSIFMIIDEVLY